MALCLSARGFLFVKNGSVARFRCVTSSFTRREGGIVGGERRREKKSEQRKEVEEETKNTNAIPNIDFDFPDDEQTKLLRNENYHQVGER